MSYLERLKQKIGEGAGGEAPAEPAEPPFAGFAGSTGWVYAPKSDALLDSGAKSGRWLISIPPERLERCFTPPISRAELAERYPGAVLIALPEALGTTTPANAQEAAELRRLVAAVAAQEGFTAEEQAEALSNALRDPATALRCFHTLLNEDGQT